jgi:hypothetical protein
MPEPSNSVALVPTADGELMIDVKEFDAAGRSKQLVAQIPKSGDFAKWTIMQQVVMLKKGQWKASSISDIVWGLAYANALGADVMKGDLFPTGEGRWGTSNKFKIRKALDTGNVVGIETDLKALDQAFEIAKAGITKDIECTATIHVKGWDHPIVRRAKLSRWYKPANPNWQGNPEHMLELNTVAHACEYVPGAVQATEDDEAPPAQALEPQVVK